MSGRIQASVRLHLMADHPPISRKFMGSLKLRKYRVLLFGAGLVGRQVLPKLGRHVDVLAFIDNDPAKHGTRVDGVVVISPESIHEVQHDVVLITSTSMRDIQGQLLAMGVPRDRIMIAEDSVTNASAEFPWDATLFLALCVLGLAASLWLAVRVLGG